jgi:hypothetical protein
MLVFFFAAELPCGLRPNAHPAIAGLLADTVPTPCGGNVVFSFLSITRHYLGHKQLLAVSSAQDRFLNGSALLAIDRLFFH